MKKSRIIVSVIVISVIIIFFVIGLVSRNKKNTSNINNDSSDGVSIEITKDTEKKASSVTLKVSKVDGVITISDTQISEMTDYDKKHVISLVEHLSINKKNGTNFSSLAEAIQYEFENGDIPENSEDSFWDYVESHGGLDTWLRGTLEYCFGNVDGVYKLYEVINPDGKISDTYIATQNCTYTFTIKDLLYDKEYSKSIEIENIK